MSIWGFLLNLLDVALEAVGLVRTQWSEKRLRDSVRAAARRVTSQHRGPLVATLPLIGELRRPEVDEALARLEEESAVLLIGEAGSGKSGIASHLVDQLFARGYEVLFLKADAFPTSVNTLAAVDSVLPLGVPVLEALRTLAETGGRAALVIDQLDSVAGTDLSKTLCAAMRSAMCPRGVVVVGACTTYAAETFPEIRDLGFAQISSEPLTTEQARGCLAKLGVDSPSGMLVELGRNLLDLSLIAKCVQAKADIRGLGGQLELWDLYRETLEKSAGDEVVQQAVVIAQKTLKGGQRQFGLPVTPGPASRQLVSRGVLVNRGRQHYRFRHEQLQDYLYAWHAVMQRTLPSDVLGQIPESAARGVLKWVHMMYHRDLPDMEGRFVAGLLAAEPRPSFYTQATALDVLAQQTDPNPQTARVLCKALEHRALCSYFFRCLANPAWLLPLHDAGFFARPPEPVETHDGYFQMPRWHADEYLVRVGHHHPDLVVDIATSIRTDNTGVQENLLRAAVHLSPADAARIAPAAAAWLGGRFTGAVPERLAELMVYLTRGDQVHPALELLKALTQPTIDRPTGEETKGIAPFLYPGARPRFDPHILETIVETHLPELAQVDPFGVLAILEEQLTRAITLEHEVGRWGQDPDGSMVWRKAIEDHPQNSKLEGMKDVLVDGIRDILQSVGDQEEARLVVSRYLASPYSIFRRLAIHTVRMHPDRYQDLLVRLFSERGNLDASDIHHEFYMLMESAFDKAQRETGAQLLEWIAAGPPSHRLEKYRQSYRERGSGADAADELVRRWQEHWTLRRLWAVRNHELPPEYRSRLEALLQKLEEPDHPAFLSYTTSVSWAGSASPLDKTRMVQMSPDEVLAYLLVYEPTERDPMGPSLEGLMDVFREVVQEQAERYAAISPRFLEPGVRPAHALHLLRGLHEAWKTGVTFDWDAVLALCEGLVSRKDTSAREQSVDSEEVLYRDCHAQVADFLRAAVVREDLTIPAQHVMKVRDILLRLLNHPEPTPEYERQWGGSNMDPATLSLNTVRGKAMHAIIPYAVHRARVLQERGIEPEVKTALEARLDRRHELSAAVHSTFGQYLPQLHYLDGDWVLRSLDRFLPRSRDEEPYWQAAWNSYLAFNPVYTKIYEMLRDEYEKAVRAMPLSNVGEVGFQRADHRLADHLMGAYWFQLEELGAEDGLLRIFFANAPDEIRAHAIQSLGNWLRDAGDLLKPEVWERLRALWAVRVAAAEGSQDPSQFSKEMAAFAWWLPSLREPLDSLFELVRSVVPYVAAEVGVFGRQVADYLATQVKAYPREAALLFLELLRRETETVSWYRTDQETWTILETAMRSSDAEAREHAVAAINLLGERGDYQYRDLLGLAA